VDNFPPRTNRAEFAELEAIRNPVDLRPLPTQISIVAAFCLGTLVNRKTGCLSVD